MAPSYTHHVLSYGLYIMLPQAAAGVQVSDAKELTRIERIGK